MSAQSNLNYIATLFYSTYASNQRLSQKNILSIVPATIQIVSYIYVVV